MGFWKQFLEWRQERKFSEAVALVHQQQLGRPAMTPRNYASLADEGYQKNVVAFSCVNKIAVATGSVKILLFQKPTSRGGKVVEIENHPILDLLAKPNPMLSGAKYWETVAAFRQLSGNSYVQSTSERDPKELWPLRPDRMTVIPGKFGMPSAYKFSVGGREKVFPVDQMGEIPPQILHMKTFNPLNDFYGMSPIEAAAFSIDQHNESGKWNVSLLQNSASPSGVLVLKGKLQEQEKVRLQKQFQEKFTGSRNAGKPLVLYNQEVSWEAMGFSPKQMDWIASKNTSSRDIALAFACPPQLLGIPGDSTFANYKEARESFWVETVLPQLDGYLDDHNCWFRNSFGDDRLTLAYDKDELDALAPTRALVWVRVKDANHISTNEKREATGYDDRDEPEADEILIPSGLLPLSLSGETAEIDDDETSALAEENGDEDEKSIEHKVFVRNDRERRRLWASTNRKRQALQRGFAQQMSAAFLAQGEAVTNAIDENTSPESIIKEVNRQIDLNEEAIKRVLFANMRIAAKTFGETVIDSVKTGGPEFETKQADVRFASFLDNWLAVHGGQKITKVQASTKARVRKEIILGLNAQEGMAEISKRIQGTFKAFSKARSMLIARTEVVSASNAASIGAAKATGVKVKKEWISSNDARSRQFSGGDATDHRKMDGEQVEMDEKFLVPSKDGPDEMDQPGDPSAPIDQIANCRCTVGFVRPEE